ncbi:MAG: HAMP domain-containing protein [Zoogloeaceae bacterium]|jgi:nitrogen fixation/metabolism regulation signal transduction histidine kinase|nr:HAMP domain-containing protein [Zoogloeaceae bacterium]
MNRILIGLAAAGGMLALFLWFSLLASTSANSFLGEQYPLLLWLNTLIVLVLLLLTGALAARLARDFRNRVFGARLRLRLTLLFGLVALLPGVLVYGVAVQFVTHSIESWFDVRVEKALDSGLELGRSVLDSLLADLTQKARGMARELEAQPDLLQRLALARLREQAGVTTAALFGASVQPEISDREIGQIQPLPTAAELKQARGGAQAHIDSEANGALRLRVLVALAPASLFGTPQVLQVTKNVPRNLAENAEAVQTVQRDYRELQLGRIGLTRMFALTLTLSMLAALFAAFAFAFYLARRLAAPLSLLAAGTQAVAQGDYSPLQATHSRDELGVLTRSFNRMTEQLADARQEAERRRGEVESARAYLESILANLSAGVLAFDRNGVLRTINEGAITILGERFCVFLHQQAEVWDGDYEALGTFIAPNLKAEAESAWQGQIELPHANGVQTLLLRGTRLPGRSDVGYVVVFDDVTQLIAAQRSAAWGEVARRLAHEIKNPLTPIQLSAERLAMKLAGRLEGKDREMLERATRTIVNQVRAMQGMVDDFRDYSRRSAPVLAALDLNALIREVLTLYEHADAPPIAELAEDLPLTAGDAAALRQVIHNLVKNGEDALESQPDPRLMVRTTRAEHEEILLEISDNGKGFPAEILARAFEPYVTTKARGTGLGLPIVRKIIDEHQGRIVIENRAEGGARIRIWLPGAHLA